MDVLAASVNELMILVLSFAMLFPRLDFRMRIRTSGGTWVLILLDTVLRKDQGLQRLERLWVPSMTLFRALLLLLRFDPMHLSLLSRTML